MSLMDRCLTRLIEGMARKKTRYGTLLRYQGTVQYASNIELKCGTLVRYGSRCEVRSMQTMNVPYRTAILDQNKLLQI